MGILRSDRITGLGGANAITGSCFFDVKNYLFINHDITLDGDFTIEWWTHRAGGVTDADWFTIGDAKESSGLEVYIGSSGTVLKVYTNNGSILNANSGSPSQEEWHHIACVRSGSTISIYVDGTIDSSTATNSSTFTGFIRLGAEFYNGSATIRSRMHMSNFRIVKGTALYTSNFTPPNTRLENITGTEVLCCQSPGNILQEATGKKIIAERANNATTSSDVKASRFTPNSPVGFSTTTDVGSQHGTTFDGFGNFATSTYMVPPGGNTRERNRGRGLVGGGWNNPSVLAQIYSVEIASDGTSDDFGDLTLQRRGTGAAASHTRGVWAGGYAPGYQDRIDFVTIANSANAIDFGNLDTGRFESSGVGNDTRGVFGPCENPATTQNVIQYITFATTGNATDFGDSTIDTGTKKQASMCSTTRGLFAGGQNVPSPSNFYDIIDQITIASTGNATDFGDLTENVFMCTGVSDATRGVRGGGNTSPTGSNTNTIDYITIASAGNATDFGDLTTANQRSAGMSNRTRGLFSGGATPNSTTSVNSIDKITIQTTGNATDFGDFVVTVATQAAGCSDSHGGLS